MIDSEKYRLALGVEYDGSAYSGWQRQECVSSVQSCVENALSIVANHPIIVFCAGRTDAGVHSLGQVIHFDTTARRDQSAWTLGVNANLPADISVRWVKIVSSDFHARFSATARRYRYVIDNRRLRPAIFHQGVTFFPMPLDADHMHHAAQCLVGEHDFSAFRSSQCQSHSPCRNLNFIRVKRFGDFIVVDVQANAFLHHMVRNIVGSLLEIGCGKKPENWMAELLLSRDRRLAAAKAKAAGLYLFCVSYPPSFELPQILEGPLLLNINGF